MINRQSLLARCLLIGTIFGALAGVIVGVLAYRLNHLSSTLNNVLLVPFYHILIYGSLGLLSGGVVYLCCQPLLARLKSAGHKTALVLNTGLFMLFACLLMGFVYRLYHGYPAQVAKNVLKFDPIEPAASIQGEVVGSVRDGLVIPASPHFKVLLFALDAASFSIVDSLVSDHQLPNLGRLFANGARAHLRTLQPTRSPIIWTSIATGRLPKEHGIWDFVVSKLPGTSYTRGRYKYPDASGMKQLAALLPGGFAPNIPYTSNLRKVKAFWNILSRHRRKVGVVGWYTTFPAEEVNGFMVSDGFFYSKRYQDETLQSSLTSPPEMITDISSLALDRAQMSNEQLRQIFFRTQQSWGSVRQSRHFEAIVDLLKLTYSRDATTFNVTRKLLAQYSLRDLDLLAVYFKSLDEVSHATCEENQDAQLSGQQATAICWESVRAAYVNVDAWVGEILDQVDDNTVVMMVSDHGFSYGELTKETKVGHWSAPDGILALSGSHVKATQKAGSVTILDVLPTLLYMQNLPVPADLEGRVLLEMFEDEFVTKNPVRYSSSFSSRNEFSEKPVETKINEEIEKKLKSLGYLN